MSGRPYVTVIDGTLTLGGWDFTDGLDLIAPDHRIHIDSATIYGVDAPIDMNGHELHFQSKAESEAGRPERTIMYVEPVR